MAEKRSAFMLFINTATSPDTAKYEEVGDGVTELTVSYNPQTNTERFINQDNANTDITGYQPNAPVTSQVIKGNPAFEYINKMRKKLPTMSDAYSDVVMLDIFDSADDGVYPATKQPVSIQIDSYGGPAADPLSVSYTLNWRGNGIEGTFNPLTKTFTAASPSNLNRSNPKTMEV